MADLRLQNIQNALINCNEADFQEVCDVYLYQEKKLHSIGRTGAMAGKNKTKKGQPDTYFAQPDGKFIFVETTTQAPGKKLLDKLKKDWLACTDPKKTGVPKESVATIYLCVNSDIPPADSKALKDMGDAIGIPTTVIQLNELAFGIRFRHPIIAQSQLHLNIDTGQLLSIDKFIQEYDKAPTVASLTYQLYGRTSDLKNICDLIADHDLTILTGKPGIGKSRIALEVLRQFGLTHPSYKLFCLSNKNADLLPDLQTILTDDSDYLLLVDDAHRQIEQLRTLIGFYRGKMKGRLKLLLTTRNFMKESVIRELTDYAPEIYKLQKLTPETIRELLSGPDFAIDDPLALMRICSLADGNPRLAVMAARWWLNSKNLDSLKNIEQLYDEYYGHFSSHGLLTDPKSLSALALVGFFHAIDLRDIGFMETLSAAFGLNRLEFTEQIDKLGRAEMVDVLENDVAIVSDQILANYAFYLVFVKKQLLSFGNLLHLAIPNKQNQLQDMLQPMMDTMGADRVLITLQPDLDIFWQQHKENPALALNYLTLFGPYQPDLTFAYIWNRIKTMPEAGVRSGARSQRIRQPFPTPYIHLLKVYFDRPGEEYKRAVDLLLAYLIRNPSLIDEAEKSLLEQLSSTEPDPAAGLERVSYLLTQLEQKFSRHPIYQDLYTSFTARFLLRSLMIAAVETNPVERNPIENTIAALRDQIWNFLTNQFKKFPEPALEAIKTYIDLCCEWGIVSRPDLAHLRRLITEQFEPENFQHCYLVFRLTNLLNDQNFPFPSVTGLRIKFVNPRFQLFEKLLGLPMPGRRQSNMTGMEYEERRAEQVRRNVVVTNMPEFRTLYGELMTITSHPIQERSQMLSALDVIVQQGYRRKPALGLGMLQYVIEQGNDLQWWPSLLMRECMTRSKEQIRRLYKIIREGECQDQEQWIFRFYEWLPEGKTSKSYAGDLLTFYGATSRVEAHWIPGLEKYAGHIPEFFPKLLRALSERRKIDSSFSYKLPFNFFTTHLKAFQNCYDLAALVYLQQAEIEEGYDELGTELCSLLPKAPGLLDQLIHQKLARDPSKHVSIKDFSGIWHLRNGEQYILSAVILLGKDRLPFPMQVYGQSFFLKLDKAAEEKAKGFCRRFIGRFPADLSQLNHLLRIIRGRLPEFYPDLVADLVWINDDITPFKSLQLLDNQGSGSIVELRLRCARQYQTLETAIRKLPDTFKYSEHLAYLKQKIAWEQRMAAEDRRRRYIAERW